MNNLILAAAVATQCVVTPFNANGVSMLCKTCAKNGITSSVICVPVKEKANEKSNLDGSSNPVRNRSSGVYNLNIHYTGWADGGMHNVLRF